MRLITLGLLLFFLLNGSAVFAIEIDSVRTIVTPVQCYGLRDGKIEVDTVFGGKKPFYYSLDGQSFTTNPIFDRLWAGDYTLHVRDSMGMTNSLMIRVKEPLELQVKLVASDPVVVAGQNFEIRAETNVEPEFIHEMEWIPHDSFQYQDTLRHTISISESTQFFIIVRDQHGCTAIGDLTVEVEKALLYIPNVIKPGSASDAYFTIFAGEGVRRVVSLQIYSRVGSLVFERRDFQPNAPLQGWGGRWDGENVQVGVYPYLVVIEFLDGKQARYEGTVTVVN